MGQHTQYFIKNDNILEKVYIFSDHYYDINLLVNNQIRTNISSKNIFFLFVRLQEMFYTIIFEDS